MKTKTNPALCLLFLMCLIVFSCKETTTQAEPMEDTGTTQTEEIAKTVMPAIDPALDPLIVGKEFSKVFADTLNIQMYELTMNPGDSVGLHQHLDHTVYVFEGGTLMLYINGTDAVEMDVVTGSGFFGGPLTDAAKNVGETTIRLLLTEIHRPRE